MALFPSVKNRNRWWERAVVTGRLVPCTPCVNLLLICPRPPLVRLPPGAGKTNIAMLSVLREVGENMRHGVIQKGDFKVCDCVCVCVCG